MEDFNITFVPERSPKKNAGINIPKTGPSSPIGMFDSGVGGLTVLKEISKQLHNEEVIYLADTARMPYGSKTPNEIVKFNYEIMNFLVLKGVKAVIMACGTSSAIAYSIIKDKYKIPVISLIEPGAAAAARATEKKKVGVIATQATVDSSAYQRAIKKEKNDIEVIAVACPLFVPLIEGGFIEADETTKVASQYLKPMLKAGIDTLVLGCTHYPHLTKILRQIAGVKVKFIDPAIETVAEAKRILLSKELLSHKDMGGQKDKYEFYVTGSATQFQEVGSKLYGENLNSVKKVSLMKHGRARA